LTIPKKRPFSGESVEVNLGTLRKKPQKPSQNELVTLQLKPGTMNAAKALGVNLPPSSDGISIKVKIVNYTRTGTDLPLNFTCQDENGLEYELNPADFTQESIALLDNPIKGLLSKNKAEILIHTPSPMQMDSPAKTAAPVQSTSRQKPSLGVYFQERASGGLFVNSIVESSAAQRGGLHEGDQILFVEGKPASTVDDIIQAMSRKSPGDLLDLTVVRSGHQRPIKITLGELHDQQLPK
jgi:hypothetical protein